jgi:DNA primase
MSDEVYKIAQKYLHKVKKSGPDNIMALCPFHGNKNTPSFTMSLSKGLYYCFSCHERGNLMMFLRNVGVNRLMMETQYKYVLEDLSKHYQQEQKKRSRPLSLPPTQNEILPEWLLGHFDMCPTALIEEDYFDEQMLADLDIGFDPKHMRITYPLRNIEGHLVGISGRTVVDDSPKYKVYDWEFRDFELEVHKTYKSHLLWNGDRIYPQAFFSTDKFSIIVVEGFKACMRWLQAGVKNVVAILGSYLSDEQKRLLERMASSVYFMLDQNEAGLSGTVLAGMRVGVPTYVIPYPDEREQPSDLLPEELLLAFSSATDFHRWLADTPSAMDVYRERRSRQRQFT